MKDIQVDENGDLRCATCGGKHFQDRRTTRAHVIGWTTVGIGALATRKKLRCKQCGAYNLQGNAQPFSPRDSFVASGVPNPATSRSSGPPPKKEYSQTETLIGMLMLTAFAIAGLVWAISSGSVWWAVAAGVAVAFFALAAAAQVFDGPSGSSTPRKSDGKPPARNGDPAFEVKKPGPRRP